MKKEFYEELQCHIEDCIDEAEEYDRLTEEGLLLQLPCKIGTPIYGLNLDKTGVWEDTVKGYILKDNDLGLGFIFSSGLYGQVKNLGKTLFLDRSKAVAIATINVALNPEYLIGQ